METPTNSAMLACQAPLGCLGGLDTLLNAYKRSKCDCEHIGMVISRIPVLKPVLHLCAGSKPKVQALTLSQIEARVEDPTVALKQLLKDHK